MINRTFIIPICLPGAITICDSSIGPRQRCSLASEANPNLIWEVLHYYHVPDQIHQVEKNLYADFKTYVIISEFATPIISVDRGVL